MTQALQVGLIGAGGIAGAHLKGAQRCPDSVRVAAVSDLSQPAAESRAALADGAVAFADPATMLAEAPIDAVIVCTPHDQHKPNVLAALAAGKHVLVEKPFGISMAECRQMVDAADRAGRTLMVGQCQRYEPSYNAIKQAIDGGEIGPIRAVRLDAMQDIDTFLPADHWLYDGAVAGGGIVISVCIHRIDLMRYLVGEVQRVTATCRTINPRFDHGAEDLCSATLMFENGALGQLFASWNGYRLRYSESFMIFGDEGVIHAVPDESVQSGPAMIASRQRVEPAEGFAGQFGGFEPITADASIDNIQQFANQLHHFAHCCRSGQTPRSSGRDNLGTMQIVFGIYESSRRDQPVDLDTL